MGQLDGKTALVTGGTSGIGRAAAKRLVEEGASVFITGRDRVRAEKAAASIGAHGLQSDISKPEELDALTQVIAERGKGLDVVFANAGGGDYATLAEVTPQHYRDNFDRNVGGTVFTVQKLLPLLNEGASIVLTGSTAPAKGVPAFGLYAASKAAIRSLGRTWAAELVDRKIRVNTLIPGPVRTPGLEGLAPAGEQQDLLDGWAAQVPMKRLGHPDEIAAAVLFLASDQSSFMTGAELVVDGGQIQI